MDVQKFFLVLLLLRIYMTIKTITQNNKQLPKKKEVNPKFSLRVKDLLKILKSNSNENKKTTDYSWEWKTN